jgi:hypothetical protein
MPTNSKRPNVKPVPLLKQVPIAKVTTVAGHDDEWETF